MADKSLPEMFRDNITDRYEPPSGKWTAWALSGADQRSPAALVHQLGSSAHNAAPGNHSHDGSDSPYLFDPSPAVSTLSSNATTAQIINAVQQIQTHLQRRGAGIARG